MTPPKETLATPRARAAAAHRRPAPLPDPAPLPTIDRAAPWRWIIPSACVLVTLAVFYPVLGHQFLDWDDDHNLVDNPAYRGLGWTNLRFMATTTLPGHWIPATWLTFGVDYVL